MSRLVHFEIHADDPARAIRFYSAVFGWNFRQWGQQQYWMVDTGSKDEPGINGGLLPRRGPRPENGAPVNAFPCTVDVPSVDEALRAVQANGGSIAFPKNAIPGVGWLAYGIDPEGNIFGVMQVDSTAK
jgi:predicted enzyme related to lactoylglutathione lyase